MLQIIGKLTVFQAPYNWSFMETTVPPHNDAVLRFHVMGSSWWNPHVPPRNINYEYDHYKPISVNCPWDCCSIGLYSWSGQGRSFSYYQNECAETELRNSSLSVWIRNKAWETLKHMASQFRQTFALLLYHTTSYYISVNKKWYPCTLWFYL